MVNVFEDFPGNTHGARSTTNVKVTLEQYLGLADVESDLHFLVCFVEHAEN